MHTLDCSPLLRLTTMSQHSLMGAPVGPMQRGLFVRCGTEVRIHGWIAPQRLVRSRKHNGGLPPARSITLLYMKLSSAERGRVGTCIGPADHAFAVPCHHLALPS